MTVDDILIETTKKLITINALDKWKNELLSSAPPVLWFGNSKSEKDKILTLGANPSRWEFLDQNLMKTCILPISKTCYETKYLSKQRFFHLSQSQTYDDILVNRALRDEIINSYDNYYKSGNSYKWFGFNKNNSYNVEGVLRGLNASYFEINSNFRACHIDIFPFATISDFNKIQTIAQRDILANSWAKNIVDELINYFNPKLILIFGRTNYNYFTKYFNISITKEKIWQAKQGKGKCYYWLSNYGNFKIVGLSVNLGNPKSFDAVGLCELGSYLNKITSL